MKKVFLLTSAFLGFTISIIIAQTSVPSGSVSGTWTLAGSPYLIKGSIQIPNDSTLTIQQGVTVNFQGAYTLNVQGRLLAVGTVADTINFISTDTTWGLKGVRFNNTPITNDTSKILYCKFQYSTMDYALYFSSFSKAIVSKCNISYCTGQNLAGGGGIMCNNSDIIISYNLISHNAAVGIYCSNGSPIISYNTISNNSNSAIYCTYSSAIIANNIISNNTANNGGGIACYDYSVPYIYNNVITNNSAVYGGGIYFQNTNTNVNPSLFNTIVWGNTASGGGSQVFLHDEQNDPNFYYCDVQGGSAAFDLNGNTYTGKYQNNINANPLFVAPSGGIGAGYNGIIADWSLQSSSPCIDKGNPFDTAQVYKYPVTDMAGNPRVTVCRIDIGAYEYQNGIPLAISLSISQPILCNGAATGGITTITSGGTLPYIYYWSSGQTTSNVFGLVAGNYTVTVSEASGCSVAQSITLGQPTAIAVDAGTDKTIICDGLIRLDAQPKWETLNSGITDPLYSVFFTSPDTGYAVGGIGGGPAVVLKTTNGGYSWTAQTTPNGAQRLFSVYFTNANTGYAVGDQGIILKTIDGGTNWVFEQQNTGLINYLHSVYFTDANTGYACGNGVSNNGGIILKTTNGGTNWTSQISGMPNPLYSVYFINVNTGYAVGSNGKFLKTTNGGTNWSTQTIGNNYNFSSVYFINTSIGYLSAGNSNNTNGPILKTTDGGANWTILTGTNNDFYSVYFTNANTGYAVGGGGTIQKTTNGTDWVAQKGVTINDLNGVYFPNSSTGYAVGNNGTILKLSVNFAYKWSPSTGLSNDSIPNPEATMINDSEYFITATTSDGCTAVDTVKVVISPLTINGTGGSVNCGDKITLNTATNNTGTGILTYSWLPITGLDSSTIAKPLASVSSNKTYTVTVVTPNGCNAADTVNVSLTPMNATEICMVGVNSINKNIVVWNKQVSSAISSFYIYRETNVTNVYQKIGTMSYDSLSVFVDTTSYPDVQSNKYKISIEDDCGLESDTSVPHKTMHLSINQGQGSTWNLIWDPYEGFTVSTYNVYRGTSVNNLQLIGTSSGSNIQYSDLHAPAGLLYYQVEVISPNNCSPSRTSYNSSRSNIATNSGVGIFEYSNPSDLFSIYPNPGSDFITLNIGQIINTSTIINIYNALGGLVFSESLRQNQQQINVGNLSNGVFTVEIKSNEWTGKQKLIIQR